MGNRSVEELMRVVDIPKYYYSRRSKSSAYRDSVVKIVSPQPVSCVLLLSDGKADVGDRVIHGASLVQVPAKPVVMWQRVLGLYVISYREDLGSI